MSATLDEEAEAYIKGYLLPESTATAAEKDEALEAAVKRLLTRDGFPLTPENVHRAKESFLERIVQATDEAMNPSAKA